MPTPDEFSGEVKFHAQDLERMRGAPKPRKPRGGKDGRTGWRAVMAALVRPFMRRSE